MPAIVSGIAVITLKVPVAATLPTKDLDAVIIPLFRLALGKKLDITINVASAQQKGDVVRIMWTATTQDGGAIQLKLMDTAVDIENYFESKIKSQHFGWMKDGSVTLWSEVSFDYFGPGIHRLPHGPKLAQQFGQRLNVESQSGTPTYIDVLVRPLS